MGTRPVVGTEDGVEAAPGRLEVGPDGSVHAAGVPGLASGRRVDRSVIDEVGRKTGKVKTLSERHEGGADLAVGTRGRLFVARPDAQRISMIERGRSSTHHELPGVMAVETDERGRPHAVRGAVTGSQAHDVVGTG